MIKLFSLNLLPLPTTHLARGDDFTIPAIPSKNLAQKLWLTFVLLRITLVSYLLLKYSNVARIIFSKHPHALPDQLLKNVRSDEREAYSTDCHP